MAGRARRDALARIEREVARCRLCPRLVAHREAVAKRKTKRYAEQTYWGRAVASMGDPGARLLVVGLAPAAHGANRTGRLFTGDRSGDWLFRAMHRYGFSSQATSVSRDDGLFLEDAYLSAVARCAPPENKPTRNEMNNCRAYLVRELEALRELRVVLCLGGIAYAGFLAAWREAGRDVPKPSPRFGHGACDVLPGGIHLLGCYHPSQQNTFTGRLTRPMFHRIFKRAKEIVGE